MTRLPRSVDDLRGLRAARWVRESTTGQFDRYGPGAQRELESGAIRRLALVDTGLEWSAAQSGATVHGSPAMRAMLASAAEGEFDLLLVGYVARWQRNLRQTLNLLEEDLHPVGVAVWFCDEELLSSNERHWDQLVDEAKAADSWLRKHRRRVREGYAAKRAEQRDPGGRPPFGFRRDPETKLIVADPERALAVLRAFELAGSRMTDPRSRRRLGCRCTRSAACSRARSTSAGSGRASARTGRRSSTRPCGRPSRRLASSGGPGTAGPRRAGPTP